VILKNPIQPRSIFSETVWVFATDQDITEEAA